MKSPERRDGWRSAPATGLTGSPWTRCARLKIVWSCWRRLLIVRALSTPSSSIRSRNASISSVVISESGVSSPNSGISRFSISRR